MHLGMKHMFSERMCTLNATERLKGVLGAWMEGYFRKLQSKKVLRQEAHILPIITAKCTWVHGTLPPRHTSFCQLDA